MSKLHIVFKIQFEIINRYNNEFEQRVTLGTNLPINKTHGVYDVAGIADDISTELNSEPILWISNVFPNFKIIAHGFNKNEAKYHLWVETYDNSPISPEQLSRALYHADPDKGGKESWNRIHNTVLSESDYLKYKVKRIKLVPEVEDVFVVSEQQVQLDKLPTIN